MVLIKVADISNEARPLDIAEPWLECLMQVRSEEGGYLVEYIEIFI